VVVPVAVTASAAVPVMVAAAEDDIAKMAAPVRVAVEVAVTANVAVPAMDIAEAAASVTMAAAVAQQTTVPAKATAGAGAEGAGKVQDDAREDEEEGQQREMSFLQSRQPWYCWR